MGSHETTGAPVSTYGYDGANGRLLTRTDGQSGLTWTRTYESQTGRIDKLEIKNTSTQATVASFDPTYDSSGNITQKVSTVGTNPANGTWTYLYDGANRMTQATGPGLDGAGAVTNVQRDYAYDGAGNRYQAKETKTSNSQVLSDLTTTYDDAGMPTTSTDSVSSQVTNYTHDAIGDLKTVDNTTDNSKDAAYSFDVYGRLTCAQMAATTCSAGVTFGLDALDRQYSRTLSGTTTTYVDQGLSENPVKTQVGAGTPTTYAYTAGGAPLGQKSGSTVGYFLRRSAWRRRGPCLGRSLDRIHVVRCLGEADQGHHRLQRLPRLPRRPDGSDDRPGGYGHEVVRAITRSLRLERLRVRRRRFAKQPQPVLLRRREPNHDGRPDGDASVVRDVHPS